jgi:alpha-galactosidase
MRILFASFFAAGCLLAGPFTASAGPLLPPVQVGNILKMTNANVRLEYDLSTGRANFYWQNSLKISGFYGGVGLDTYITGTDYSNRVWTAMNNEVDIVLTGNNLPMMKQVFILDQDDSFLTRLDMMGNGLQSRWMGPVVMDIAGGVDIGAYADDRALIVPFDNDSFSFVYNAMPINNTSSSYEVSAFYDNTSRNGLVAGSVTHDSWKTGVYFQGSNNKLNVLNVYGGVTSSDTRDTMAHGLVTGNTISSPTVFVGFGSDWRTTMEDYANANASMAPRLAWNGGVPFGWNTWYPYAGLTNVNVYSNSMVVSDFIKTNLQSNNFNDAGVVYINLDANGGFTDAQLQNFVNHCHGNGQKAGVYYTPFVYWDTESNSFNNFIVDSGYKWSEALLRDGAGHVQSLDSGLVLDPTHPGVKQAISYYFSRFKGFGFEYVKLDFLTHAALEGAHHDPNITTGLQAYNQGMRYITQQNNGRMFLSESIAPIFPYQYAHARRITCDTATDSAFELQALTYGWWLNSRLYQFNDPDNMKFAGMTANQNQSRLLSCVISGTVFINGDDLTSGTGQSLARTCLTNAAINEVARAGVSFRAVEGNTGTSAADTFLRQDGSTWYVAVFNYSSSTANKNLNLARLGISGTYTAVDLWSGAVSSVSGTTWTVSLGANQAKLFRLGSGPTTSSGPISQTVMPGSSLTLTTIASGTPPFTYVWRKDGNILNGQTANTVSFPSASLTNAGTYKVQVTGGNGIVTNSAIVTVMPSPLHWAAGNNSWDTNTSGVWKDSAVNNVVYRDGNAVQFDDSAAGSSTVTIALSQTVSPASVTVSNVAKDYSIVGPGDISGAACKLIKSGTGKLSLGMANDFAGGTVINAGILQVGAGGTAGNLGSGPVLNNATLSFNHSNSFVLNNWFRDTNGSPAGTGRVLQLGPGNLVFGADNMLGAAGSHPTQSLIVSPGSIAEAASFVPVGPVTLTGSTLFSSAGNSGAYPSWVLTGGLTVLSNPVTSLITNADIGSDWAGPLAAVQLIDATTFNVGIGATNGIDLLVPATLTHSYYNYGNFGKLIKTGSGKMVLTGSNYYQNGTVISNGVLQIGNGGTTGNLPPGYANVVNYSTLAFNRGDTYTWSPPAYVGGSGTIQQMGTGKLVLNSYIPFNVPPSQSLYVGPQSTAETVQLTPIGMVTLNGGTLSSSSGNSGGSPSWVLMGGVTVLANPITAVITNYGTASDSTGPFSAVQLVDPTTFNVAHGTTNDIDLLVPATLTHSYYDFGHFGTLIKTGLGTMVLSGSNLYQGGTTISAGVLLVNNPTGSGTGSGGVTIQSGAMLGGTGYISGAVTAQPGSIFSPGAGIGKLTVGSLSLQGAAVMEINRSLSPSNDLVVVSGSLNFGGTLIVTNLGPRPLAGDTFKLFSKAGNGVFNSISLPVLHGGLGWVNNLSVNGSISVVQAVNPAPINLSAQFFGNNLVLNWPLDHTGWQLEAQTNSLGVGLSANWYMIPGSTLSNQWVMPIQSNNAAVFYRLVLP